MQKPCSLAFYKYTPFGWVRFRIVPFCAVYPPWRATKPTTRFQFLERNIKEAYRKHLTKNARILLVDEGKATILRMHVEIKPRVVNGSIIIKEVLKNLSGYFCVIKDSISRFKSFRK